MRAYIIVTGEPDSETRAVLVARTRLTHDEENALIRHMDERSLYVETVDASTIETLADALAALEHISR